MKFSLPRNYSIPIIKFGEPFPYSFEITQQPNSVSVLQDTQVIFTCKGSGGAKINYQWQNSLDGIIFYNIANANKNTYSFTPTIELNGYKYRCVLTSNRQTLITAIVTLTVLPDFGKLTLYKLV